MMPFGNRKKKGSFQFSIVTIQKISPPRKPEISLFRHFPKLELRISMEKILAISPCTQNTLGCYRLKKDDSITLV